MANPANSFGFMDGGVDALDDQHFSPEFERRAYRSSDGQPSWPVLATVT